MYQVILVPAVENSNSVVLVSQAPTGLPYGLSEFSDTEVRSLKNLTMVTSACSK